MSKATPPPDISSECPRLALNAKEAAKALGIGPRLLWELTSRGEIPIVRLNARVLYPVAGLQAYLAANTEGGGQ